MPQTRSPVPVIRWGNRPVAGIFSFGQKPAIKRGMKARATWFLKTVDGRDIYKDLRGMATFKEGSNMPFEFIDGQHPFENKQALAIEVSNPSVRPQ